MERAGRGRDQLYTDTLPRWTQAPKRLDPYSVHWEGTALE